MNEPTVACILLTRDRSEMAQQAVECFRAQAFENKRLLIWDTGASSENYSAKDIEHVRSIEIHLSIGMLRNHANMWAIDVWKPDIFVHFDDDDLSHPDRIAEQVALLQASGAECVGYRECLFWDMRKLQTDVDTSRPGLGGFATLRTVKSIVGEAWLYSCTNRAWAIGSSFCYWRTTWERHSFPDLPRPDRENGTTEDVKWRRGVNCVGVTSLTEPDGVSTHGYEPRLICRIHGSNSQAYDLDAYAAKNEAHPTWRRAPEWDEYCRRICG